MEPKRLPGEAIEAYNLFIHGHIDRRAFLKQAAAAHPWQFAPRFSKVIDTANNELQSFFAGKESLDDMLNKIDSAARDALG